MRTKKIFHQSLLEPVLSEKLELPCRCQKASKAPVVSMAVEAFIEHCVASGLIGDEPFKGVV